MLSHLLPTRSREFSQRGDSPPLLHAKTGASLLQLHWVLLILHSVPGFLSLLHLCPLVLPSLWPCLQERGRSVGDAHHGKSEWAAPWKQSHRLTPSATSPAAPPPWLLNLAPTADCPNNLDFLNIFQSQAKETNLEKKMCIFLCAL